MLSREGMLESLGIEHPFDLQSEHAVLGSILLDQSAYDIVAEILQGGEFYDQSHARIFRAMRQLREDEQPVDLVTLTGRLQDSEELDKIGGVSYLAKMAESVPTASNVAHYAGRVQDIFLRRQAVDVALNLLRNAGEQQDVKGFIAIAETAVSKLSDQTVPAREFVGMKQVLMQVWDEAEERYNTKDINRGVTGIPSGFIDLDRMTAGFQRHDLIIVAARPSVGKTAFALNIAQNVGVRAKETVAIFSLEMSAAQLVQRMICAEGQIDGSRMRTGRFEAEDWDRMALAVGVLANADIQIDDTPGITVNEIRAKCRRLKKERGLGMILIDYLQLIQGNSRRGANRQEEVSQISRTLKQIARELEVPVIALSQLSRGVEQRQDKRPMMSDLRESGSIEQDADIVAFLYRDDYYDKESDKKNIIEIIISKQRNGPVGTVELVFLKNYNKFVNLEQTYSTSQEPQEEPGSRGGRVPDMYRGHRGA
ncbi:replicative DNA helicase [Paenibacillus pinisoli]|uniref:Replicative DNA helicase n=1 Tax=Paenibacillus pinisoli TaxID=1276110 RepID=A0A3A6PRN2_9BACL|nr:replicative DNA helicase [Paenibacillus pinisoli]RJX40899.1 replicative DNA helicase [Paenibacillus pinisoli]